MIGCKSCKKWFLLVVSTLVFGSIGFFLLLTNKIWPFDIKKDLPDNRDLFNDLVTKGTKIYIEQKIISDRRDVELKCYSLTLIIKALTSDKSDEIYKFLTELKVKDMYGLKNFIIYLKSKLMLETDKNEIFRILQYFIDKNETVSNFEEDVSNFTPTEFNIENLGNYYNDDSTTSTSFHSDREVFSNHREKLKAKIEDDENRRKDFSANLKISEKVVEYLLKINIFEDCAMLKKVIKKENDAGSILENIFCKFLIRDFYEPTINDDLIKLIPDFKIREGNPFLADKEIFHDINKQDLLLKVKNTKVSLNEPIPPENRYFYKGIFLNKGSPEDYNEDDIDEINFQNQNCYKNTDDLNNQLRSNNDENKKTTSKTSDNKDLMILEEILDKNDTLQREILNGSLKLELITNINEEKEKNNAMLDDVCDNIGSMFKIGDKSIFDLELSDDDCGFIFYINGKLIFQLRQNDDYENKQFLDKRISNNTSNYKFLVEDEKC